MSDRDDYNADHQPIQNHRSKMNEWDMPVNWRERTVDPSTFSFITSLSFSTKQDDEEHSTVRIAQTLLWTLLLKRIDEIAEIYLTAHQKRVYDLWIKKGHTYQEIGAILSEHNGYSCEYSAYTAISHCIKGIRSNKHGGRYHGGIENRLKKRCEKDPIFVSLLEEWEELKVQTLPSSLSFLSRHDTWYEKNKKEIVNRIND